MAENIYNDEDPDAAGGGGSGGVSADLLDN